jgi:hypothetical protein
VTIFPCGCRGAFVATRRLLALASLLSLPVVLLPATAHAEPHGTTRGFIVGLPTATPGFALGVADLIGPSSWDAPAQRNQSGSTAEYRRSLREAKRDRLAEPQRTGVEAGLAWLEDGHWLQRVRAGWNGFLPTLGGFPSGSGQAFGVVWSKSGVGVRYPDESTANRVDLRGSAAVSLRGYYFGLFQAGLARIGGSPVSVNAHIGYQYNSNESFYGFGQSSRLEDRISFGQTVGGIGFVGWWRAPWWLYIGGGVGYRDTDIGAGSDDYPPPPDFDPGEVPGYVEEVEYLNYDAFVQVDWRNEGNPYRGGLYAVRWTDWNDQDTDVFSFRELDIEVQQYFPVLKNKRVIALRARTIITDTQVGREVPFYLMPTLGGTRDLRGYNYARFRDRNMILLNAEYRAEIWLAMDLALFVDAGKVVAERKELDFDDLATNYGIGLRIKTSLSTFLRADFAFGGEGFHAAITFDNIYDTTPLFSRLLDTVR